MTEARDLGPCILLCGRAADHRHHWTARLDPAGPYLDADSTVPVCVRCHATEHAGWRATGLETIDDPLLARVQRTTWLLGRWADLGRPVTIDPVTLRGLHVVLVAVGVDVVARLAVGVSA